MYEQPSLDNILFYMLYAAVAAIPLIASCYLLFRRGNAFAPDITPPSRLRRWTAVLLVSMTGSHLWYMPTIYASSSEDFRLRLYVGSLLDFLTVFPLAVIVMLTMLQDRRRPLWPAYALMTPIAAGIVWCLVSRSDAYIPAMYAYILLWGIGSFIYMVRATRQYGRWLRDNYADLEHKEVWQSFLVLAVIFLLLGFYVFGGRGITYEYIVQVSDVVLVCYLLWRVETLSDLGISQPDASEEETAATENKENNVLSQTTQESIRSLLQQYCIDKQLYLQHDLTIAELAKIIGTNRFYLSQYFSYQGTTYNEYINNLRINHFVSLYREAVASQRRFTVQQLAHDSGYRSYSTFSTAFKQRMGQNVTTWMHDNTSS